MKKKKSNIIVVVCVLAAAGIAAGIYGMTRKKGSPEAVNDSTAQTVQEQTTQEVKNPHAGQAQSVISGKWESSELAQQKAVAVMYSNIKQAMPQSNISKADIVFESLVEGGITRLCCFFENQTENPPRFQEKASLLRFSNSQNYIFYIYFHFYHR